VVLDGGQRYVDVQADTAEIRVGKQPGQRVAMSVQVALPADVHAGGYGLSVAQANEAGQVVGGASGWFVVAA
jgi:hypothetical protein